MDEASQLIACSTALHSPYIILSLFLLVFDCEQVFTLVPDSTADDVNCAVEAAYQAFPGSGHFIALGIENKL